MRYIKYLQEKAFSLVELLTVMAVAGILMSFAIPSMVKMSSGSNVTRAGLAVGDQVAMARQNAVAANRSTEVRFIKDRTGSNYVALQIWEYDANGATPKAIRRMEKLSEAVLIASGLSPLLSEAGASLGGTMKVPSLGTCTYTAIRFRANGRIDTSLGFKKTYLTVVGQRDNLARPVNYYTIQINPFTGRLTTYRP